MNKKQHDLFSKGIPDECLNHLRNLGPEDDGPKMGDGMPIGFSVVRVRNCPICDNYKVCRRKCRIKEQDLDKHKKWIERNKTNG